MKKKEILKEILSTSLYLLGVLLVTFLLVKFVVQRTEVLSGSMEPTLYKGESYLVDKISYRFKEPERYDIITFKYKYAEKTYYVKRIIGLPGEKVFIDEYGTIFINDKVLVENYGNAVIENPGLAAEPIKLGDDEYFVMGDNRNDSQDSRYPQVGAVKREQILGKLWVQIWPLNRLRFMKGK
ncbi:MAG: signal peptidase I [Lachnospiraceae bacterium]|nr:signal peptidase I [Lachnospiraceae bacterium]